jgi:hypothetical protein
MNEFNVGNVSGSGIGGTSLTPLLMGFIRPIN